MKKRGKQQQKSLHESNAPATTEACDKSDDEKILIHENWMNKGIPEKKATKHRQVNSILNKQVR